MRIWLLIIGCWLANSCYATVVPQDTLLLVHETEVQEAVVPDPKTLSGFEKDPDYNYYEDQARDSRSIREIFNEFLRRMWLRLWDVEITETQSNVTFWIVLGAAILVLIAMLVYFKPGWFYIDQKRKPDYQVDDETIYGVDFDRMIREALSSGNYTDAIRWRYLQLLKKLQEKELIAWDPNKTVNEYVAMFKNVELKPRFKELSFLFLYFRYGNFEARKSQYDEVDRLSSEISQRL